ncbi:SDR family oxidoreductase [Paenibacillus silvae]|uniref:SDR family oxidoreductase n=1 Tax=Paenibacillus silvae TaxID=1325358 RepID=UPI00200494C2|nr:SDR family oxidoreductase [Paenibacillus silvae]MCK6076010.1 SDR family oxidoreductase [Paenibacillus silvae]MCK6150399.1 SDR family oxidoreductase [Paenibacillus silvae]MCK6268697.1 SDR family oxidoreductase [Paenibacillus silvae]
MNVLVIGANGQIGKHLVEQLAQEGKYQVTAMIRKPEQADTLKKLGAQVVMGDLEGTVDELAEVMKDQSAIVFTAGSGGSTGPDKTLLIDLDGAVKTMEAAEKQGISRYILVSAYGADQRSKWPEEIKPYYVAKHFADRALFASELNYTIIRPGGLKNEPGIGKVTVGIDLKPGSIAREDVARVIAASLQEEKTYRMAFDLVAGGQSISDALGNL